MLPINGIVTLECLCAIYGILVNLVTMLPSSSCHKTSEKNYVYSRIIKCLLARTNEAVTNVSESIVTITYLFCISHACMGDQKVVKETIIVHKRWGEKLT